MPKHTPASSPKKFLA